MFVFLCLCMCVCVCLSICLLCPSFVHLCTDAHTISQDSFPTYRPASILFSQSADDKPFVVDPMASPDLPQATTANVADGSLAEKSAVEVSEEQPKGPVPLLLTNSALHQSPLTLLPPGSPKVGRFAEGNQDDVVRIWQIGMVFFSTHCYWDIVDGWCFPFFRIKRLFSAFLQALFNNRGILNFQDEVIVMGFLFVAEGVQFWLGLWHLCHLLHRTSSRSEFLHEFNHVYSLVAVLFAHTNSECIYIKTNTLEKKYRQINRQFEYKHT